MVTFGGSKISHNIEIYGKMRNSNPSFREKKKICCDPDRSRPAGKVREFVVAHRAMPKSLSPKLVDFT